jgi:filamentous hemagglutinin family protein
MNALNTQVAQPRWRIFKRGKFVLNGCAIAALTALSALSATSASAQVASQTSELHRVVNGTVSVTLGQDTVIEQGSDRALLEWDTFGTTSSESIEFKQHLNSDIAINKVIGGQHSNLYGKLTANGTVYILNGNGITFHNGSETKVGSLLATTADALRENADGSYSFIGEGLGSVTNEGAITISDGGFGVLIAPNVANYGKIQANLGQIELGSSNNFTINTVDLRGDGLIKYAASEEFLNELKRDCGPAKDCLPQEPESAGVTNGGLLLAPSGRISLTGNEVAGITAGVVNLTDRSVIDASAFASDGNGGTILVTADYITNAQPGNSLFAHGGKKSGNGGDIELSGTNIQISDNTFISASAANGKAGSLIIDPTTITIADGAGTGALNEVSEDLIETISGTNGTDITILADERVTVQAISDGEITGGAGSITLQAGISSSEGVVEFQDIGNTISTTTGDITIIARTSATDGKGVNIGNLTTGGTDVVNPGKIHVSTSNGGDIVTGNLTVTGTDSGSVTVLSAGSIQTNDLTVDIDDGDSQDTNAYLTVAAINDVTVNGNITVNAKNISKDGDSEATAHATIIGSAVSVAGETNINADALVSVPFDVVVEFLSTLSARYQNSLGYYKKDASGNPITGEVVFDNIKDSSIVGDTFTFTTDQLSDFGLFIISDGNRANPTLTDNAEVTFSQVGGKWTAFLANGTQLSSSEGSNGPAFFSDTALNSDGFAHAQNSPVEGNLNFEDLLNGGDQDFNDANVNITTSRTKTGDANADALLDITSNTGDIFMGNEVNVIANAKSNNGNADSTSVATLAAETSIIFNDSIHVSSIGDGKTTDAANGNAQTSIATLTAHSNSGDIDARGKVYVSASNISSHGNSTANATGTLDGENVTVVGTTTVNAESLVRVPFDVLVEFLSTVSARYRNSVGYYKKDSSGNPITGEVVFDNTKDSSIIGSVFTLTTAELSDFGLFIIADGDRANPTLTDNAKVTFSQVGGKWTAFLNDGTQLNGENAAGPAFFSDTALNADGFAHAQDSSEVGNVNFEDLLNGGDRDQNDVNLEVTHSNKPGDATAIATLNVTTNNGSANLADVNVNSKADTNAGFATSSSVANFRTTEGDVTLADVKASADATGTTGEKSDAVIDIAQSNADLSGAVSFNDLESTSTLDKLSGLGYTLVKVVADAINFNGNDPLSTVQTTEDGSDTTEQEVFTTIETSGAVTPDTAEIFIAINTLPLPPVIIKKKPPVIVINKPPVVTTGTPTPVTPPASEEGETPDSIVDTLRPTEEADLTDRLGSIAPAAGGADANGQFCSVVNTLDINSQNYDPELCERRQTQTIGKKSTVENFISSVDLM